MENKFGIDFKVLKPGIAQVGDLYLAAAGLFSEVQPGIVKRIEFDGFSYEVAYGCGFHSYGRGDGILVKKLNKGIEFYADTRFLSNLKLLELSSEERFDENQVSKAYELVKSEIAFGN